MEWNDAARWGWAAVLLINAIGGWILWSLNKKFIPREDCTANHAKVGLLLEKLQEMLDAFEHRQTETEARLDNLPPLASVHAIQLTVAELRGELRAQGTDIRNLGTMMKGIERDINRLTDAHMKE